MLCIFKMDIKKYIYLLRQIFIYMRICVVFFSIPSLWFYHVIQLLFTQLHKLNKLNINI